MSGVCGQIVTLLFQIRHVPSGHDRGQSPALARAAATGVDR
jgi:hypothetical protein